MNRSFYDLPHDTRFAIYGELDRLQCKSLGGGLFSVAVAKGKFGELVQTMEAFGLEHADLYYFPLGTDNPPDHLRHDNRGFPDCCWLIATFTTPEADHAPI
jgi:hypothetical protein